MTHTHESLRKDCAALTRHDGKSGLQIGRVWIERAYPVSAVSLGNVVVRVFSDGAFLTIGRFNQVAKAILHEANRGA